MSWALTFEGDQFEVESQFTAEQDRAKANKMPELEQVDIGDVGQVVRKFAMRNNCRVSGTAGGHWNLVYGEGGVLDEKLTTFGRVCVNIERASS